MSQLLVVFGATGQQGGSVVNHVLSTPSLRSTYKIRGVTRDVAGSPAQKLQKSGVEVVAGDVDKPETIKAALAGAHTVFAMTFTVYDEHTKERENRQGRAIADAAVASGAQYLIWSTEVHAGQESGGKCPVDSFDVKYDVEQYIRTLPIRNAFVAPGSFMQNLSDMMAPRSVGDGKYLISSIHTPETKFPWLDVVADLGKFVGIILAEPENTASGKTVQYSVLPPDEYRSFLPPSAKYTIVNMLLFIQDFGYYGTKTEKEVKWSIQQVDDPLVTLEKYVQALQLS